MITSSQTEQCYIGSTIQTLNNRFYQHYNNFKDNRQTTSKIIMKYDDAHIVLLEEYPCNNILELEQRERFYIQNLNCCNKRVPGRTNKEWENDNKEKVKLHKQQYRKINKEKIKETRNKYRKNNKEQIRQQQQQYRNANKEQIREHQKQYRKTNKEQIKQKNKLFYKKNKEALRQQGKEYHEKNKESINKRNRDKYNYIKSWGGGDARYYYNNLLKISLDIFK